MSAKPSLPVATPPTRAASGPCASTCSMRSSTLLLFVSHIHAACADVVHMSAASAVSDAVRVNERFDMCEDLPCRLVMDGGSRMSPLGIHPCAARGQPPSG